MEDLRFEIIDLFAGAGGTTTGVEMAESDNRRIANVIAAVNHDLLAIESHAANHSDVMHFREDIRTLDVTRLPRFTISPNVITGIWASLECTNFSQAKGGQSRDADSRTLAEHLYRYIEHSDPDYVWIENVKEFMTWGPLIQKTHKTTGELMFDKKGKPIMFPDPKFKGDDYRRWVEHIKSYGYNFEYRMLNSADFGAYTSRIRFFGIFAKIGMPIRFPSPTHEKHGQNNLLRWKAVRDVLELENEGESIFNREARGKKPLVQKTMNRIAFGIDKFVLKGQGKFLMSFYTNGKNAHSIEEPCKTLSTKDRFALVSCKDKEQMLLEFYGRDNAIHNIDEPAKTISTNNRMALLSVEKEQFLTSHIHNRESANNSLDGPANTILAKDPKAVITVEIDKQHFIQEYYGGNGHCNSVEDPLNTITTKPHQSLVSVELNDNAFISSAIWGVTQHSGIDEPAKTIMTEDEKQLIQVDIDENFIANYYSGQHNVSSIEDPLGTITTNPKHSLITVLKENGYIKDIRMRMLKVSELKRITGFEDDYILKGSQAEQKKFIGNAVVPVVSGRIIEALYSAIAIEEPVEVAA